jgi:5-methylcytosine-specific restriction endonuclease McrA
MAEKVPNEIFTPKQCRNCGLVEPVTHGEVNDVHGYKLRCPHCDSYVGWGGLTQPLVENGERKRSSQWTAKRLGMTYCQLCLRPTEYLGKGERLEMHHVRPVEDGGSDYPTNIWTVCTACHRLIHHQRRYLYEHMQEFLESYEAMKRVREQFPNIADQVHGM